MHPARVPCSSKKSCCMRGVGHAGIRKRCGPIAWCGSTQVHARPRRSERDGRLKGSPVLDVGGNSSIPSLRRSLCRFKRQCAGPKQVLRSHARPTQPLRRLAGGSWTKRKRGSVLQSLEGSPVLDVRANCSHDTALCMAYFLSTRIQYCLRGGEAIRGGFQALAALRVHSIRWRGSAAELEDAYDAP